MPFSLLPTDILHEIFLLLDIEDAWAISIANPRTFGAYIGSKRVIRFRNAINSYLSRPTNADQPLSSFVSEVMRNSMYNSPVPEYTALVSWLARKYRPILYSSIVDNNNLFKDLSSIIALKERGFASVSSRVSNWTVVMKAEDERVCSVSLIILFRIWLS
jgi:hypothetical protein